MPLLFERLEIGNNICAVFWIGQPFEKHLNTVHDLARVGEIDFELLRTPRLPLGPHVEQLIRVSEIGDASYGPPNHVPKRWADLVHANLSRVAIDAGSVEYSFTRGDIAFCARISTHGNRCCRSQRSDRFLHNAIPPIGRARLSALFNLDICVAARGDFDQAWQRERKQCRTLRNRESAATAFEASDRVPVPSLRPHAGIKLRHTGQRCSAQRLLFAEPLCSNVERGRQIARYFKSCIGRRR